MKTLSLALFASASILSSQAFAAGDFTQDNLVEATQIALKAFSDANPDHVVHLSGFKTWKSGTDAKVKIYVAHDGMNMEYNYACAKHDTQIHCGSL